MSEKKILIVDDSATGLAQFKSIFSRTRCAVITAIDGKDALKKVSDEHPDILLKMFKKFIDIPVRNHIRVSIDTEVGYFHNGKEYSGLMHNISSTGGFIETADPLPTGSIIHLTFSIPHSEKR